MVNALPIERERNQRKISTDEASLGEGESLNVRKRSKSDSDPIDGNNPGGPPPINFNLRYDTEFIDLESEPLQLEGVNSAGGYVPNIYKESKNYWQIFQETKSNYTSESEDLPGIEMGGCDEESSDASDLAIALGILGVGGFLFGIKMHYVFKELFSRFK